YNSSQAGAVHIRYGDLKKQLAEDMVAFMAPIRQKANDILANSNYLAQILENGKEKARQSASLTLREVRQAVGVQYY
ncbi:MAG TPA: tryptophan--tRNA ligase, partial [Phnomibacter sp.]|nr:tryptophan--tRNA ligase [Phnomibacter sp.]